MSDNHKDKVIQSLITCCGIDRSDAFELRCIAMTLHRWHELECGDGNGCIERDEPWAIRRAAWPEPKRWWNGSDWDVLAKRRTYSDYDRAEMVLPRRDAAWEATGAKAYWLNSYSMRRAPIADREAGAQKRLAKVMKNYPTLQAYIQGDPRGASLYILRPGDVPPGATVDSCYNRGVAVYK